MSFALITGASKGIGKFIAGGLAAKGYDLLLVARSADLLGQLAAEFSSRYHVRCDYLSIDLARPDAAATVYAWTTSRQYEVSVLVNNAGYGLSGAFEKYSSAAHQEMIQVNIGSLVSLCRCYLPDLKNQPQAYILNIASTAAYQAVPFLTAYAASKAFVLSFSRGLRDELKGTTVSVTCICPGPTDTDFINRAQVGAKGLKTAEKFNMTPEAVASIAVKSLFAGRAEVIPGAMNKFSSAMVWLLPKPIVEKIARNLYD